MRRGDRSSALLSRRAGAARRSAPARPSPHAPSTRQIAGFSGPSSVAFDANDNVWITDSGHRHPNRTRAATASTNTTPIPRRRCSATPDTHDPSGICILDLQVAVDQSNGEVFVAQSNGRTVDIFEPQTAVYIRTSGARINGSSTSHGHAGIHVAIDNTQHLLAGPRLPLA